jgi:hypothetical protein
MQGLTISNPRLEFLRPALERWADCIDRYNQVLGDSQAPFWFNAQANLGLLSAAAWMAEMVTLENYPTRKQQEEGDRSGRNDLYIATKEEQVFIQAKQRWPQVKQLSLQTGLLDAVSDARKVSYPNDLKLGCLFVSPWKAQQSASPEEMQDMVDELQKENACAIAWYFPYPYRKLRDAHGNYHPGIAMLLKQA